MRNLTTSAAVIGAHLAASALIVGAVVATTPGTSHAAPSAPETAAEHHMRVDIPRWVVRPCTASRVVNCRVESNHPHSIRLVPGSARMVCVFYAQHRYAATHDYCQVTR